jgi:hypothetical protein
MGKKKPFIDKKNSTTYSLIFRETEDVDDEPERLLVPTEEVPPVPDSMREDGPSSAATARAYLNQMMAEDEDDGLITEDRRKENILMGFPDDGYDYVKHLRTIGARGKAVDTRTGGSSSSAPSNDGPSIYIAAPRAVPPSQDAKVVDATATAVDTIEQEDDSEDVPEEIGAAGTILEEGQHVQKLMLAELKALEAAMAQAELDDADDDFGSEGEGDLEDEFIIQATAAPAAGTAAPRPVVSRHANSRQAAAAALKAALASRREASQLGPVRPTTGQLEVLEDRFSMLLGEYDEAELGDLEYGLDAAQGEADLEHFADILDQFLAEQRSAAALAAGAGAAEGQDDDGSAGLDDDDEDEYEEYSSGVEEGEEGDEVPELRPLASRAAANSKVVSLAERDEQVSVVVVVLLLCAPGACLLVPACWCLPAAWCCLPVRQAHPICCPCLPQVIAATKAAGRRLASQRPSDELTSMMVPEENPREHWDCESVLSIRSNVSNHPRKISEPTRLKAGSKAGSQVNSLSNAIAGIIKLSAKTGLPSTVLPKGSAAAAGDEDEEMGSAEGSDEEMAFNEVSGSVMCAVSECCARILRRLAAVTLLACV